MTPYIAFKVDALLRYFGYAKVPLEARHLLQAARTLWEEDPTDQRIGKTLKALEKALEKLMRSAR